MTKDEIKSSISSKRDELSNLKAKRRKIHSALNHISWNKLAYYDSTTDNLVAPIKGFSAATDNTEGSIIDGYVELIETKQLKFNETKEYSDNSRIALEDSYKKLEELNDEVDAKIRSLEWEIASLEISLATPDPLEDFVKNMF